MEFSEQNIEGRTIVGFAERTTRLEEAGGDSARIPGLWRRFFEERLGSEEAVGVYSAYAPDDRESFLATAGIELEDGAEIPPGCTRTEIHPGRYLVFESRGPMPETAMQTWARIGAFFDASREYRRAYTTDFEVYRGSDAVLIHIAIE
jgi:predicted transcriptional regulator YdeE